VRLVRELGRGGMGLVWLGQHEFLDREVAVKFMLGAAVDRDDPRYQTFLDGARAASQVRHLAMTAVLHAELIEGIPYIVMEYVSGPTLTEIVDRTGPMRLPAVMAVLDRVADALEALHLAGVVHRDIKPSNILIDAAGHAFLTDFGLACRAAAGNAGRASGRVCGTPTYMSPEAMEGEATARTDVYALALTTYHLLAGKPPFEGSVAELRQKHKAGDLPLEPLRLRGVPSAAIEVLQRGAAPEPIHRTKSARKFLEAFREAAGPSVAVAAGVDQLSRLVPIIQARDQQGTAAASSPSVEPPPQPMLVVSVPCERCGYDLKGLLLSTDCPECQLSVERSLRSERLIFADARWMARVRRGMAWMMAVILFVPVAALASSWALVPGVRSRAIELLAHGAVSALVTAPVLALAIWRAGAPEPGSKILRRYRPRAPVFALVCASATIVCAAWALLAPPRETALGRLTLLSGAMVYAWAMLLAVATPSLAIAAYNTLKRGPRHRLRLLTAIAIIAASIAGASVVVMAIVLSMTDDRATTAGPARWIAIMLWGTAIYSVLPCAVAFAGLFIMWRAVERRRVDHPSASGLPMSDPSSARDGSGSSNHERLKTLMQRRRETTPEA